MSNLVYSSEFGSTCPTCKKDLRKCKCSATTTAAPSNIKIDGFIRVGRETKGRSGSGVTTVSGFDLSEAGLKDMGKTLKAFCGTGGTVKNGMIEIQGEHRDKIMDYLNKKGFKTKRVGG